MIFWSATHYKTKDIWLFSYRYSIINSVFFSSGFQILDTYCNTYSKEILINPLLCCWKMQFEMLRLCFIEKLNFPPLFCPPPKGKQSRVRSSLKPIETLSLDDSSFEGHGNTMFMKPRSSFINCSASTLQWLIQCSHLMRRSTIKTSQLGKRWEAFRALQASCP